MYVKKFLKNIFFFDYINKFQIRNSFNLNLKKLQKIVISFNILNLTKEISEKYFLSLLMLEKVCGQKAKVQKYNVKRRGPKVNIKFLSKVTLQNINMFYFFDLLYFHILYYLDSQNFSIKLILNEFGNIIFNISDVVLLSSLEKYEFLDWKYSLNVSIILKDFKEFYYSYLF